MSRFRKQHWTSIPILIIRAMRPILGNQFEDLIFFLALGFNFGLAKRAALQAVPEPFPQWPALFLRLVLKLKQSRCQYSFSDVGVTYPIRQASVRLIAPFVLNTNKSIAGNTARCAGKTRVIRRKLLLNPKAMGLLFLQEKSVRIVLTAIAGGQKWAMIGSRWHAML